jgi:hypothetical protein
MITGALIALAVSTCIVGILAIRFEGLPTWLLCAFQAAEERLRGSRATTKSQHKIESGQARTRARAAAR